MKTYHWALIVLVAFIFGMAVMGIFSNMKIAKIEKDWNQKVEMLKDRVSQTEKSLEKNMEKKLMKQ